jgi:hypothetical protein
MTVVFPAPCELGRLPRHKIAIGRPPSSNEKDEALSYVRDDASRLKGLTWMLFNLDEFIFVR